MLFGDPGVAFVSLYPGAESLSWETKGPNESLNSVRKNSKV